MFQLQQKKFTYAVRDQLSGKGWISGRKLRRLIHDQEGVGTTLAAFYHKMARLEGRGFVKAKYAGKDVYGHRIRERQFKWCKMT